MDTAELRIGLCGGHRTGKTTLAGAVSRKSGIPFVRTSTSGVFAENGLDPAVPMDFDTRLWIQHKVIESAEKVWKARQGSFITDRTPLDMLAYTLGDINGTTEVDFPDLRVYSEVCFSVTNELFTHLVIIQPGIPLVYEKGKAALNRAYIEHLNSIIIGLCHDQRTVRPAWTMPAHITGLDDRVHALMNLAGFLGRSLPSAPPGSVQEASGDFRFRQ